MHLSFATRIYLYGTNAGRSSPAAIGYVDVQPRSAGAVANGSSTIRSQVHGASSTGPIVGIQYSGWHGPAATTLAAIAAKGGKQLSLEEVIMSDGALDTSDIYDKYGMEGQADGLYYMSKPLAGYYCVYRHQPGDTPNIPDCPDIPQTTRRQAQELLQAGVDYVATDATNLCHPSNQQLEIQARPTQALADEWTKMRQAGEHTPNLAVWGRLVTGCTTWQADLDSIYNNATINSVGLIQRDPKSGKKLWITPNTPDPALVAKVQSNGGRNDVIVQEMWAEFGQQSFDQGRWSFMARCRNEGNNFTTLTGGRGVSPCNQYQTKSANVGFNGTAMSVSPSYQASYASLPFGGAGKLNGATLKRQFGTAIRQPSDFLFLDGYNELCAQPQKNPFVLPSGQQSPYIFSQGLPNDTLKYRLFVDTYGEDIGRDLEPTVTHGTRDINITASCNRVIRLQALLGDQVQLWSDAAGAGSLPCTVAGEMCCEFDTSLESWTPVWSLTIAAGVPGVPQGQTLLTSSKPEFEELVRGGTWKENCNFIGPGGMEVCVDRSVIDGPAALQGPFQVRSLPEPLMNGELGEGLVADSSGVVRAGVGVGGGQWRQGPGDDMRPLGGMRDGVVPGTWKPSPVPIFRCMDASQRHFVSNDKNCEGLGKLDSWIGWGDAHRSSSTARELIRCKLPGGGANAGWSHTLDGACPPENAKFVAFVH